MEYLNFHEANCQNCYKCIRQCKVQAIKISEKQAKIVADYCVGCGECFDICPQNAKSVETDIKYVQELIKNNEKVVVSLAPSFPSYDNLVNPKQFITALRELGFSQIEGTTIGAVNVSKKYEEDYYSDQKHVITSSCPTVNFLVAKYFPDKVKYLSKVVSPMMAHNKIIKKREQNVHTVFIGPCISKKEETVVCTSKDSCIDAVITFDDIRNLINERGIDINSLEPSNFDYQSPATTRWYPLSGGVEKATINKETTRRVIKIDGMKSCVKFLETLDDINDKTWIEMNACEEGCINGFGNSLSPLSLHKKIENVINYIDNENTENDYKYIDVDIDYNYDYIDSIERPSFNENQIQEVLHKTGKFTKDDELNCGACGYDSCREKAIAVLQGMAEIEMCLPYMRMINEDMSNMIIENTPNGIVVVNNRYEIVEFNPSSVNLFMLSKKNAIGEYVGDVLGDNIFLEMDPNRTKPYVFKRKFKKVGKTMIVTMKYIENHDLFLGIFKDVTREENQKLKHKAMSIDALEMAQNVIDKQMRVAHEIASLLGETTAETKVTLSKLKMLFDEDGK